MKRAVFAMVTAIVAALVVGTGQPAAEPDGRGQARYADVHGLRMYYEVHGKPHGQPPLVLLHGSFSATGTSFGKVLPELARRRQVIAIEQQAHGHTADIDRTVTTDVMADDTIELLRQIGVHRADFYGYSMGGAIAFNIGLRYPDRVRKLVLASITFNRAGNYPGVLESVEQVKPEDLFKTSYYAEYLRIAPHPEDFPRTVQRVKEFVRSLGDTPPETVRSMRAPMLLIIGDSDVVRPEHTVEFFRLRGGGVLGQTTDSELAILPDATHPTVPDQADLLLAMIPRFLDRPNS